MTTIEETLALVRAGMTGDRERVKSIGTMIAANLEPKSPTRARQIRQILDGEARHIGFVALPIERASDPYSLREPAVSLDDVVLADETRREIDDLVEEHRRADDLRAADLAPRNRLMLMGPPGNGKTMTAEALACALGLQFLVVRYENVVKSHMGETPAMIATMFKTVERTPCVLLVDEFDVIASRRGGDTSSATREHSNTTSALLVKLDEMPSHVLLVAATNRPSVIDRAVWRRFDIHINMPVPDHDERMRWAGKFGPDMVDMVGLVEPRVPDVTFAELASMMLASRRAAALGRPSPLLREVEKLVAMRALREADA